MSHSDAESRDFDYRSGLAGYLRPEGRRPSMGLGGQAPPRQSQYSLYSTSTRGLGSPTAVPDWEHITDSAAPNNARHLNNTHSQPQSFSSFSNHHPSTPPALPSSLYTSSTPALHSPPALAQSPTSISSRSTLWWGELEPWMDEEYAKQVCALMGWDPLNIKVPHPAPDPTTGQQANNPGYCFLTFPSPAHAANVLSQMNNTSSPMTMPNSTKPFVLNWASAVPAAANTVTTPVQAAFNIQPQQQQQQQQQYPREYSIFVGDLAPETSNSDLVAVFRNPVLGLRNDREPKFIRPFISCKSAKIMLDPVTGVSRGYGFVRFTDESDQQRALIEMHGLYCLSRPMRISPATAKFKPPTAISPGGLPQVQFPADPQQVLNLALSSNAATSVPSSKSVSAPIAATTSGSSLNSTSSGSSNGSGSTSMTSSGSFVSANSSEDVMNLSNAALVQLAQKYANGEATPPKISGPTPSITSQYAQPERQDAGTPRYMLSEESWKHHAQARAILGNLIGPNGEQLTSTDPYNTTVFVGGLSPLISEDTLRTFFAPFGDIHYVKVPAGKHCGFVQFVKKADAERAIEKMQGFPVGGSRIRLSWGRSQYKAAQAAAQAAQAAALQSQFPAQAATPAPAPAASFGGLSQEQALQMLQKLAMQGYLPTQTSSQPQASAPALQQSDIYNHGGMFAAEDKMRSAMLTGPEDLSLFDFYSPMSMTGNAQSSFSPFSPDPNFVNQISNIGRNGQAEGLPHPSKAYAPGFFTHGLGDEGNGYGNTNEREERVSPNSNSRLNAALLKNSPPAPISRPSSGQAPRDSMHGLSSTLSQLDLDRDRPWKSPAESSESSGASVQFQMTASP